MRDEVERIIRTDLYAENVWRRVSRAAQTHNLNPCRRWRYGGKTPNTRGSMKRMRELVLLVLVAGAPLVHAQNWPGFRGATSGVAADNPALPDHWTATENVAWKVDIPGRGWSSPVVWGDHVFVVTAVNDANPVETFRPVTEYIGGSLGRPTRGGLNRDQSERRWAVYALNA